MRFLGTIKTAEDAGAPPAALVEAMDSFLREAISTGAIVETGGLAPTAEGVRLRVDDGERHITDGPFIESKEVVGGYVIFNAPSRDAAMEWATRFVDLHVRHWPALVFECEVRQMLPMEGGPTV